jgi:histidinol-phosphate/aromatic aminotransferase/cobyric acid decarboxylase-like protein
MTGLRAPDPSVAQAAAIPPPGAHGDDGARVAAALGVDPSELLDLAQTLNPVAPDIARLARDHLDGLRRYPNATRAAAALAEVLGCAADRLVLTNGGADAIALVAAELETGWVDEPDFSLYRRHLRSLDPAAGRWRSNPHNPTGRLAAADETVAVWDEAFWPITTGTWTRGGSDDGVVVVGSLTKLFACPGLRVGYVVAPDRTLASRLRHRQAQWSVNGLATSLLPELVEHSDLGAWTGATRALKETLVGELAKRGLDVTTADAPWVLVHRVGLRTALARHAVLVRDCATFGWPDTFRVATPRADDLPRLLEAVDRVLNEDCHTHGEGEARE